MLRQLLSNPNEDIGIVKPLNVEYKPGQEFASVPSGYYAAYPPTDYNYNITHLPSQPSVIQQAPYSHPYPPPPQPLEYAPTSTSDLYSSTYAMLSSDGLTTHPEWAYAAIPEKPAEPYSMGTYPLAPAIIHNIYAPPQQQSQPYHDPNITIPYPYSYAYAYDQTSFPSTSAEPTLERPTSADLRNRRLHQQGGAISGRSAQAAFSESFRKIAKIDGQNFEDDDGSDGERVMCLACKGVYTSRRSLTGHIGRNEKCREIIGRTYLDTLVQTGQSDILLDPNSIEGGISPICPNCNRFISHYKGNIRRHVNQCTKRPSEQSYCSSSSGQPSPNTVNSVAEHYAAMAPVITKDNPAYHQVVMHDSEQDSMGSYHPDQSSLISNSPNKKKISAVAVQSTNPYSCAWCKFTTVYKGNMKRHLISVHNCTDELLRKISFDLETLRALAHNRPVAPLAPQPEKIRGCSGRKRKCKPKNEKFDDPKRMKLLGENEIPPAAVSDVVASFATTTQCIVLNNNNNQQYSVSSHDEVLLPISSHDSGISSGSSIDEC